MTISVRQRHQRWAGGFSLVEITLALGVLAFALVAIMGLVSASLQSSRESMDDTLIAEMSTSLLNTVRQQQLADEPSTTNVFFTASGERLNQLLDTGIQPMSVTAALAEDALYQCVLEIQSDPTTLSADGSTNLWLVSLDFRWPVGADETPNQQTIRADIAKY